MVIRLGLAQIRTSPVRESPEAAPTMLNAETLYLPVSELAKRIQSKALSSTDLTQAYLERSQKIGPALNAYARLTPELALEQADAADKEIKRGHYRGPLHGIPYAAKDLLAVKGIPTTWGAKPFENQVFDYDATVIERSLRRRAGATCCSAKRLQVIVNWPGEWNSPVCFGVAARRGKKSLEYQVLDLRLVVRIGRDCRRRAGRPSPSARKRGARLFALPLIAASAGCARRLARSAATVPWPLPIRWTKSGRWPARWRIARTFLP